MEPIPVALNFLVPLNCVYPCFGAKRITSVGTYIHGKVFIAWQ